MSDTSVIFNVLAKDNASGVMGKIGGAMSSMFAGVGIAAGGAALNAVGSAFDFAKNAVFGFNSTLENSKIAFSTMLGSGQKAQSFLNDLQTFAKATPFEFEGLVKNAQNMMGMGIAAKDVIPDLTALGDSVASVGGSADQVDQVTLAFDQMFAKGTLDMGNMNQLMQGGVPNALRILADSYKVTTGQMIQMISTGKVQSADALPKLITGLEKGTKSVQGLGGMMDKQSQTFSGALSNIKDGLTQALAGAFKPFFSVASEGAQKLGAFFSSDTFSKFGEKVSSGIGGALNMLKGLNFKAMFGDLVKVGKDAGQVFGPVLKLAIEGVGGALKGIKPTLDGLKSAFDFMAKHKTTFQAIAIGIGAVVLAMTAWNVITKIVAIGQAALNLILDANPIGLIILAVVGLVAAFIYLWNHSEAFRKFWIGLWNDIWGFLKAVGGWFAGPFKDFFVNAYKAVKDGLTDAYHWVVDKFNAIIGFVTGLPGKIASAARGMWDGMKDAFKAAINWIIGGWNKLHFTLPSFDTHIPGIGKVGGFDVGLPQIPKLAAGGIVQVGERGTEIVRLPSGSAVYPHGSVPADMAGGTLVVKADNAAIQALFDLLDMRVERNASTVAGGVRP